MQITQHFFLLLLCVNFRRMRLGLSNTSKTNKICQLKHLTKTTQVRQRGKEWEERGQGSYFSFSFRRRREVYFCIKARLVAAVQGIFFARPMHFAVVFVSICPYLEAASFGSVQQSYMRGSGGHAGRKKKKERYGIELATNPSSYSRHESSELIVLRATRSHFLTLACLRALPLQFSTLSHDQGG